MQRQYDRKHLEKFAQYLKEEERSQGTIEKYLRDVAAFGAWLEGRPVTKKAAADWKEHLWKKKYAPSTVNSMLSAVNRFFRWMGWQDCRVKFLKIQRRVFRDQSKVLTRAEYERLISSAIKLGRRRLALIIETICAAGIRVSEIKYITVESARACKAEISLKGKIRVILLPPKLCKKLLQYAKEQETQSGEIFLTKNRKSLSRRQIWSEMKQLCKHAKIAPSKVFPHNLRHLFARTFYRVHRDIAKLADVLGHMSIETTRIYLLTTGKEHARQLERLQLVL